MDRLDYSLRMVEECGLTIDVMWFPKERGDTFVLVSFLWSINYPCVVNERRVEKTEIEINDIVNINTYSGDEAVKRYGDNAKDGVLVITTK